MRDLALTIRAKQMRREPTEPERRLWDVLRAKRFGSIKFRQQKVIGAYIADFASREPMIVVEVDGDTHAASKGYDEARTAKLEQFGYRVIRFSNHDVMANMDGVFAELESFVLQPPLPTLSPEGERAR